MGKAWNRLKFVTARYEAAGDVRVYVAVNFNATLTIIESCLYGLLLRAQQVPPNIGQNAFLKFRLSYRK